MNGSHASADSNLGGNLARVIGGPGSPGPNGPRAPQSRREQKETARAARLAAEEHARAQQRPAPPMTIGADVLPGLAKMAEEAGELVQVIGKLIATEGARQHWDGSDLHERLVEEAGDVLAAVQYFAWANSLGAMVDARAGRKFTLFHKWHQEEHDRSHPGGAE